MRPVNRAHLRLLSAKSLTCITAGRLLINEINANHESKRRALRGRPGYRRNAELLKVLLCHNFRSADGLQHNVVLIRELNQNIARIVQLYKELSARYGTTQWHGEV